MIAFEYLDHTVIRFDDSSYRWIDIKRFVCDPFAGAETLLTSLVGHRRYRDDFLSPDSHERDTPTIHGPYLIAAILPASFERIGPGEAIAVVREFASLYHPPPPAVWEQIQATVMKSLSESVCLRLRALPDEIHEYGNVLMEFRELAFFKPGAGELFSVVMAID